MTTAKSSDLLPHQAEALFDLLVHRQLYVREVVRFNRPNGIDGYGPPFDAEQDTPSTSPVLQSLLYRFVLPLPGLKSVSPTFWINIRQLVQNFSAANLSQSYEHTGIGLRRTLASGTSALLEYPARGMFGGLRKEKIKGDRDDYDPADPDDMKQAFGVLLQEIVYGDEIDALFDKIAETPDLGEHDFMIQSAHEYIVMKYEHIPG
jgi:PX-associated